MTDAVALLPEPKIAEPAPAIVTETASKKGLLGKVSGVASLIKREAGKLTVKSVLNRLSTSMPVFGDIISTVKRRKKLGAWGVVKGIGSAIADQVIGRTIRPILKGIAFVTITKIMAVGVIAGIIGGSFIAAVLMTAAAIGTASAIYECGKTLLKNRKRKKEKKVKPISKAMLITTGIAFGKGAVGGSLGAWFIQTELAQGALGPLKDVVGRGFVNLLETFNLKAPPLPKLPEMPGARPPETEQNQAVTSRIVSVSRPAAP